MKGIRSLILGFFAVVMLGVGHFAFANEDVSNQGQITSPQTEECKGVKLNTNLPFL